MLRPLFGLGLGKRLPTISGTIHASVDGPITITRDAHGIAYVEAETNAGAFYGMGFCQGQDRAFQIELYLRVARGTLSELVGDEMLSVDRLMRRIGLRSLAEKQVAVCSAETRAQIEAFARGVNDGIRLGLPKKPHEYVLLGAEPSTFEPPDVLAVLQFFAFALSSNWDAELARLKVLRLDGEDALRALEPSDPKLTKDLARLASDCAALSAADRLMNDAHAAVDVAALGGASNAWAIAPSKTATKRPLLASDPHLQPTLPSPWYLMHVRTPSWAMSGACLPSQPVITFGHNEHLAWGITAGHVDNTDLFVERISPDGTRVREGDAWVPCEIREEVIKVRGKEPVTERVLVTKRGPIVSPAIGAEDVALSMRGTWMAERPVGGYGIYGAKDLDEAFAVYASYPSVSENRIFATKTGRIAQHVVGDAPIRKKGSGMVPAPGWDRAGGWEDEPLRFPDLPQSIDPPAGFVAAGNQWPGHCPKGEFIGADFLDDSRYERICALLASRDDWDIPRMMRLQLDRKTVLWPRLRPVLLGALKSHGTKATRVALRLLEAWDGDVTPTSSAASVFEMFFADMIVRIAKTKAPRSWRAAIGEGTNAVLHHGMNALRRLDHLVRLLETQPEGWFGDWRAEIVAAFESALRELERRFGPPERWAWGRVRPLLFEHAVGTKKPMDRIFNRGPYAFGGDATTIPQASVDFGAPLGNAIGVPNLRTAIDVGHWEESRWVLAGGQSGNPMSPHYDDLLELFLRGEGVTMAWSPESIKARGVATLRLLPS